MVISRSTREIAATAYFRYLTIVDDGLRFLFLAKRHKNKVVEVVKGCPHDKVSRHQASSNQASLLSRLNPQGRRNKKSVWVVHAKSDDGDRKMVKEQIYMNTYNEIAALNLNYLSVLDTVVSINFVGINFRGFTTLYFRLFRGVLMSLFLNLSFKNNSEISGSLAFNFLVHPNLENQEN